MSTSTWTTTTSATGMPTIEPEPCRKRTASFRSGLGESITTDFRIVVTFYFIFFFPTMYFKWAIVHMSPCC
ncbi:Uncharacterized protein APZ42_020496 [Daphnia magna]|uniref:Uncharacterized protein n=1 Tax=Daphnia magna TaxID=35525 RepID=A0A164XG97_9CRUS|nr:Uncharacterized protein APZ42_020496 [Daphnia magna]